MKYIARNYYECENGARWSECVEKETESDKAYWGKQHKRRPPINTQDGDICNFSGCANNHKVSLIKSIPWEQDKVTKEGHLWFKRPEVENFQGILYKNGQRIN